VVENLDPVLLELESGDQVVVDDPAAPAVGAIVEAAADQLGIGEDALDGGQFRV
jgi:hypothetical protein